METFVILFVAAWLGAGVVWWASTPRRPRPRRTRPPPVRFRDTFTTVPDPPPVREGDDGWVVLPPAASDDRPSPVVALVRIALTIAFVAALGVGAIAGLWFLFRAQLGA